MTEPSPRISWMLRFALAVLALMALLPTIMTLAAYGWIPRFQVTNFAWDNFWIVATTASVLIGGALLFLAISGRNPFHRVELALIRMRTEEEARIKAASMQRSKHGLALRLGLALLLVGAFLLVNWMLSEGFRLGIAALMR